MNKKLKLLLASAICVIGIFGESAFDAIKNISPAKTTVKVDEPSIEYKTLVQRASVLKIQIYCFIFTQRWLT